MKRYLTGTPAECELARVAIDQIVGNRDPVTGTPLTLQAPIWRNGVIVGYQSVTGLSATSEPILPDDGQGNAAVELDDTDRLHLMAMGRKQGSITIPSAASLARARDLSGGLGRAADNKLVAELGDLAPEALDDRNALPPETRAKLIEIETELGPGGAARVRQALQRRKDAGSRAAFEDVLGIGGGRATPGNRPRS